MKNIFIRYNIQTNEITNCNFIIEGTEELGIKVFEKENDVTLTNHNIITLSSDDLAQIILLSGEPRFPKDLSLILNEINEKFTAHLIRENFEVVNDRLKARKEKIVL